MEISIKNLGKSYSNKAVLKNLSMNLRKGELVSIVGPSGVGKTTLLRILSGMEQEYDGDISYTPDDYSWKPVIMVFQDFMLFPHITVRKNIGYGIESQQFYARLFPEQDEKNVLKRMAPAFRRRKRQRIAELTGQYVEQFGLRGLEHKYPSQLSAGQRQRVSLARAMLIRPSLLLLDEPFANLDQNLKMETALFIRRMQQQFGVSILAVTHDLQEAFAMSDRIGVMLHGAIPQISDVETLYRFPVNAEVGRFLGAINVLPEGLWQFCEFPTGSPAGGGTSALGAGGAGADNETGALGAGSAGAGSSGNAAKSQNENSILVRAESVELIPDTRGHGIVRAKRFQGTLIHLEIEIADTTITSYRLSSDIGNGERVRIIIRDFVSADTSKINAGAPKISADTSKINGNAPKM
ncbi:MAG: ABC transporter ATP-binding protein [Salinispira sp.]